MENQIGFPGSLPDIPAGLGGGQIDLVPGQGFWARIEQIAVKGEMTRGLDTAMHGRPSPRIWLFLHEPGRGELSAAVAMSFARELAFRDQAALVLDCDDRDQALTRWTGRLEAEGWIDLARYGTSVLTSGLPMPFVGRRGYLLGVGSFAPTDVTGEEVDTLLTRLRRQADDLLLVASSDSAGLLWAPAAAIRILCWDRQTSPAAAASEVAAKFEEAGCPLTGVVTFQETGAVTENLVDEVIAESEDRPEPAETAEPAQTAEPIPAAAEEVPDGPLGDVPADLPGEVDDGLEEPGDSGWKDLPLEQEADPETVAASGEFGDPEPEEKSPGLDVQDVEEPLAHPAPKRETSRVFWVGALVAVAIIVAVSVYYLKFVRVPTEGHFEQIEIATDTRAPGTGSNEQVPDETGPGEMAPTTAAVDSLDVTAAAAADTLAAPAADEPQDVAQAATEQADTGISTEAPPEQVAADVEKVDETPAEVPATPPAVFDMEPYREPVGAKGWALHLYSLPDSAGTVKQVKELDRRGFQSAVKVFDLGDKGRWRRIYLGSFESRAAAKKAMPALLEKLRVDWAKPEIFKNSAPE
ncbi:MAG: SPOR domain-containing protein [Candidatus Krumholzibacteriota bacterium]